MRGSPIAYQQLKETNQLNDDTLYFIYREDALDGELYLGSKLIAGAEGLASLNDIEISSESLKDKQVLAYDAGSDKWVNTTIEEAVNAIFVGATANSSGIAGLVPPPAAGQTNLFLRSDGTWQAIETASSTKNGLIRVIENSDGIDHNTIITQNTADIIIAFGDIIVIKDLIIDNKWQYTAYVYDSVNWVAMDGNYNAENIYFDEDLITTTPIGNIILNGGQATIAAAGKNLKEVFETIFVQEDNENLKISNPTGALSGDITYYEIGSTGSKDVVLTMTDDGAYKYGYTTEVIESGVNVIDIINDGTTGINSNDLTYSLTLEGMPVSPMVSGGNVFTLTPFVKSGITSVDAFGIIAYGDGKIPVSNLKRAYPEQKINADIISVTKEQFRWYIPFYQGFTYDSNVIVDHATISAEQLNNLNAPAAGTSTAVKNIDSIAYNKTKLITATAQAPWRQYYIAYPKDWNYKITNMKDSNGINCTIRQGDDIVITYGNEDFPIDITYSVYYVHNAITYDTLTLSWSIVEEEGV